LLVGCIVVLAMHGHTNIKYYEGVRCFVHRPERVGRRYLGASVGQITTRVHWLSEEGSWQQWQQWVCKFKQFD